MLEEAQELKSFLGTLLPKPMLIGLMLGAAAFGIVIVYNNNRKTKSEVALNNAMIADYTQQQELRAVELQQLKISLGL